MPRSKALLIAGGVLVAIGFSLAIGNFFYLGHIEENAKLLFAPELEVISDSPANNSDERAEFLTRRLELERDQSVLLHAALIAQIQRERRTARDNALLWFAAMLLFGVMAGRGTNRPKSQSKRDAA